MKYIEYVNQLIGQKTQATDGLVLFGQNIAAGSHISGLTKNLKVGKGGLIINTQNSENTLTGVGFGMMLNGISSIFLMKQQDFLLLGADHLANTYNFIRRKSPKASFTIVFVIVDAGYHGLQSSINNFGDLCSLARVPGFTITNREDAREIINAHLISPGFRIIGVSQRLFGQELLEVETLSVNKEKTLFEYKKGAGATIVCFNLSFPQGLGLHQKLQEKNIDASLFSVNAVTPIDWSAIIEDVKRTKNLVVLDDSKSENVSCDNLLVAALAACRMDHTLVVKRNMKGNGWLFPNPDELEVDYEAIAAALSRKP
jgi:pyruvate/2-oxoglutarate/acetoin dehydrogenase E1 component